MKILSAEQARKDSGNSATIVGRLDRAAMKHALKEIKNATKDGVYEICLSLKHHPSSIDFVVKVLKDQKYIITISDTHDYWVYVSWRKLPDVGVGPR